MCSARERLLGTVDKLRGTLDLHTASILVTLVRFHSDGRIVPALLPVLLDYVLVYVDSFNQVARKGIEPFLLV